MPRLSQEQKEARRLGIGSSDVAKILGLSRHGGAFDVFNDKIGIALEEPESEQQQLGHEMEPMLAAWYERTTGAQLLPGGSFAHPEHPWARCTLDFRIAGVRRALECKNVGAFAVFRYDADRDDGVPHDVRAQVTWQCGIVDLADVDVAAMLGGYQRRVFRVALDPELWSLMLPQCLAFWERVQAGEPPPLDESSAAREYLRHKYPDEDGMLLDLSGDDAASADALDYFAAHADEKRASGVKKTTTARMIDRTSEHAGVWVPGKWKFTHKKGKGGVRRSRWTNLASPDADEGEA